MAPNRRLSILSKDMHWFKIASGNFILGTVVKRIKLYNELIANVI